MRRVVAFLFCLLATSNSELFTDEANARLPKLFHLDEYERCLLQKNGLYCLGEFDLSPVQPSPIYERIKEYSLSPFAFNRSRLHRGYCLSERCPSRQRNATVRFERCVSERVHKLGLKARLHKLHHCTSHRQHTAAPPPQLHRLQITFLQVVGALLALNLIGTLYDITTKDDQKKIGILAVWSVRASWQKLTAIHDGDPRLNELDAINGIRSAGTLLTLFAHSYVFHFQYYVTNPQFLENFSYRPEGVLLANGTSIIQVFVLVANFLLANNLLIYLEKHKLSLTMLPLLVIKRFARIGAIVLLIVGFAATWWPRIYSGPFHSQIEKESATCRRKFWSHVFFYNNIMDKHNHCILPTWFFPVDMHLHIISCVLIILMQHRRQQARRLFGVGFIISSIASGIITYINGYLPMVYIGVPDNIRGLFSHVESFGEFYVSSWNSLPACFLGLYLAYLYYDLNQSNYDFNDNKWLKIIQFLSVPVIGTWTIALAAYVRHIKHPLVVAAFITLDRQAFIISMAFFILGVLKIKGFWGWLYSWSGWRYPARLSFIVMLCHWPINSYIAARSSAYHTSEFDISIDYIATVFLSYLVALPLCLLVEIPVQRFISQLI